MPTRLTEAQLARLWARVERRANHQCWVWTGSLNRYGFPRMRAGRAVEAYPTRVLWAELRGPLEPAVRLARDCRNTRCVNPWHARPGRTANHRPRTHCHRGHAFTEATTYRHPAGSRICRLCRQLTQRARQRRAELARIAALEAASMEDCA